MFCQFICNKAQTRKIINQYTDPLSQFTWRSKTM